MHLAYKMTSLKPVILKYILRRIMNLKLDSIWSHLNNYSGTKYDPIGSPVLTPPLLVKSAFPVELFTQEDIKDVFVGLTNENDSDRNTYCRIYIDGMLSPKAETTIFTSSFYNHEGLNAWLNRIFDDKNFGIIINATDRWSESLSRKMSNIFIPLTHLWGIPNTSIETTLFIGNYGYTPFGIHIDDPYTTVFHFHIGPCRKRMTLFEKELFHKLNGPEERCYSPDDIIDEGQSFDIDSGDVFMLPPHYYHVGFTKEFSVGIAVAVSRLPDDAISSRLVNRAINLPEFKMMATEVLNSKKNNLLANDSVADWLCKNMIEYTSSEQSNKSLRYSRQRKESTLNSDSEIQLDSDFPLKVIVSDMDRLILFVRGNRISLKSHPALQSIFNILMSGERMKIEFLKDKFGKLIEPSAIEKILVEIDSCGGLQVWNND
jgi:hypothetical protein